MVTISVKTDFKDISRKLNRLSTDLQKKVVPAALNKVIAKANTEMTRQIVSEFNIQAAEVRTRLRVIKARRNYANWFAVLDPFASNKRGRSLNLIRFVERKVTLAEGRRRKQAGSASQLRFQIKRGGGKKIIKGAFIANNGRTVFIREGDDRLPIKALSTIDVPQMFNTRRIQQAVMARINREMVVEFDRAIKAAIAGSFR
jgi:hypothetical protein